MSNVLVIAEIFGGALKKTTLTTITFARDAAKRTGGKVHALAIGTGIGSVATELAGFVDVVHVADDAAFKDPIAETYAKAIAAGAKAANATVVCMAATAQGKDFLPRAAALLGAGMASDVLGFATDSGFALKRPMQAGNVIATVEITTPIKAVTTRPTEFDAAAAASGAGTTQALAVDAGTIPASSTNLRRQRRLPARA